MQQNNYIADNQIIKSFYNNLNCKEFKHIPLSRIIVLKFLSAEYFNYYNQKNSNKKNEYLEIMNRIKNNPPELSLNSEIEKFILFMFSVDTTLETLKIYNECDTNEEIKKKMIENFGIYDPNLITIEKHFIKLIYTEKEINKLIKR